MDIDQIRINKYTIRCVCLSVFLFVFFSGLLACSTETNQNIWPPVPPIELPLDFQKSDSKIETDFQITEKKLYAFGLRFLYKGGDQDDRIRVNKLSGGHGSIIDGKIFLPLSEKGVPLSLRLTVYKFDNSHQKQLLLQNDLHTDEIGINSWGDANFDKELESMTLEPGKYHIQVKTLYASPELSNTTAHFSITFAYRGK